MGEDYFYKRFKSVTHSFIMNVYDVVPQFPTDERFGASDQLRRAAVSIMLNYVEGFGRKKENVKRNFFEISYGSLRECKYLIFLAKERKWISFEQYQRLFDTLDEMGAMLWSMISGIEKQT